MLRNTKHNKNTGDICLIESFSDETPSSANGIIIQQLKMYHYRIFSHLIVYWVYLIPKDATDLEGNYSNFLTLYNITNVCYDFLSKIYSCHFTC